MAAVADDTGLEVDALGGAPGVYSARYAGEDATYADNVAKLLRELARARRRRRRAAGPLQDGGAGRLPRRVRGVGRGRAGGHHRHGAPGRPTASATTRCSCPTAGTGGRSPRCGRRRRTRCRTVAGPSAPWPPSWPAERRVVAEPRAPVRRACASAVEERIGRAPGTRRAGRPGGRRPPGRTRGPRRRRGGRGRRPPPSSASPHGMTASIRRSLPPPSMSSSPKPKVRRFSV